MELCKTLGRKCESSTWHTFWLCFNAPFKSKHSWSKMKRAKFDNEESYKTFARRHNRRRHNEFLKQQASKGWDDVWDTPKGAARARQADDMASTLPDEQLWMWMTQGSSSARTARQQRKGLCDSKAGGGNGRPEGANWWLAAAAGGCCRPCH